jgi:hypothetical protein
MTAPPRERQSPGRVACRLPANDLAEAEAAVGPDEMTALDENQRSRRARRTTASPPRSTSRCTSTRTPPGSRCRSTRRSSSGHGVCETRARARTVVLRARGRPARRLIEATVPGPGPALMLPPIASLGVHPLRTTALISRRRGTERLQGRRRRRPDPALRRRCRTSGNRQIQAPHESRSAASAA